MLHFYSHELQDEFVYCLTQDQAPGTYLDVACGNPRIGSNTFRFEQQGWQGWPCDLRDCPALGWYDWRTQEFCQWDATSDEFGEWLKQTVKEQVDYASIDVDAAGTNLALPALKQILKIDQPINIITFEHEAYIHGPEIRDQSRQLLEARGMFCLFPDVRLIGQNHSFEDWWINPEAYPGFESLQQRGLEYNSAVKYLKQAMGLDYWAHHHCSRAFLGEYDLFWEERERNFIQSLR